MNSGTIYASGLAAQLSALATMAVVRNDSELKAEIDELENYVTAYGAIVHQVHSGLQSFSSGIVSWQPLTYPMMEAGGRTMVEKAEKLSARLCSIVVPERTVRIPAWVAVKSNAIDSAKEVVSTVASTAKSTVATAVVVGAKTLVGRNPFRTLLQRIGEDRVNQVVDSIRNPVNTIQAAASNILPRLKRGLDLGVDLGTEVADALADMIPEHDYVTPATAEHLEGEVEVSQLTVLKALAESLEQSIKLFREIAKAEINAAAASAIRWFLDNPLSLNAADREQLRLATSEIAETDLALAGIFNRMNELFQRFVAMTERFHLSTSTGALTETVSADVELTSDTRPAAQPAAQRKPEAFPLDAAGEAIVKPVRAKRPRKPPASGAAAPRQRRKNTGSPTAE